MNASQTAPKTTEPPHGGDSIAAEQAGFVPRLREGVPFITVREAAAALGRVGEAGRANEDFVQNLIDAGALAALPSKLPGRERTSWRIAAISVRLFFARNFTGSVREHVAAFMQLFRDVADDLPLDALDAIKGAVCDMLAARQGKRSRAERRVQA